MTDSTPGRWLVVVVLPLIGFALLWWANRQATDMRRLFGSTFEPPDWWTVLGWLATMIASGVLFGFAAGIAGVNPDRTNTGRLLVIGIIPAAIVVYYFMVWGVRWLPLYLNALTEFLITPATVTVSSVAVGLLTAGIIGSRTAPS